MLAAFDGLIAAVLDGGPARLGRASTVVRLREGGGEIIREGALSPQELRGVLGQPER